MSATGDVVFQQGIDNDSDVWDDTALIEAYDQAVRGVKEKLVDELGAEVVGISSNKDSSRKKSKKKKKGRPKGIRNEQVWLVGSRCRAVFGEDGVTYDAVITSVDRDAGTCWIRYLGYGNEEEQNIGDLMPLSHKSDVPSDVESMEFVEPGRSPHQGSTSSTPRRGTSRQQSHVTNNSTWPGLPTPAPMPPYLGAVPPMPPLSAMPPGFPLMPPMSMPGMSAWPGMPTMHSIPMDQRIPNVPPPPPVSSEDDLDKDSDALHSMLISWYMSGYHTGYYQGLKEGKKSGQNSRKPSVGRGADGKDS